MSGMNHFTLHFQREINYNPHVQHLLPLSLNKSHLFDTWHRIKYLTSWTPQWFFFWIVLYSIFITFCKADSNKFEHFFLHGFIWKRMCSVVIKLWKGIFELSFSFINILLWSLIVPVHNIDTRSDCDWPILSFKWHKQQQETTQAICFTHLNKGWMAFIVAHWMASRDLVKRCFIIPFFCRFGLQSAICPEGSCHISCQNSLLILSLT